MVKSYYDLGQMAGLNVVALDYIGNAMLQLIKTQTNQNTTTMVIQLGSESTVLNIVQGDNLLLQRTVPYGTNSVVNVVMEPSGFQSLRSGMHPDRSFRDGLQAGPLPPVRFPSCRNYSVKIHRHCQNH